MVNGVCDICGCLVMVCVCVLVNGRVQNMELCDQYYSEMVCWLGCSVLLFEFLFGWCFFFDEFFGESGFGSFFGDSLL